LLAAVAAVPAVMISQSGEDPYVPMFVTSFLETDGRRAGGRRP